MSRDRVLSGMLREGSKRARDVAGVTMDEVRRVARLEP